jgi:glutathione peroxidase
MQFKQKMLKWLYPLIQKASKKTKMGFVLNKPAAATADSFYNLRFQKNNGEEISMEQYKGKKVMVVNTATHCGFTGQFDALQEMYEKFEGKLEIIGFPANDFKNQEPDSDDKIAESCRLNFGVSFPLAKKSSVVKNEQQHPIFAWLSDPQKNGWNQQEPIWNFTKYLIDENGQLEKVAGPAIDPKDLL